MCPASRPGPPMSSWPASNPTTGQQESPALRSAAGTTVLQGDGGRPAGRNDHPSTRGRAGVGWTAFVEARPRLNDLRIEPGLPSRPSGQNAAIA